MSAQVIFYGASDDLLEVDGDVPGCDEYTADANGSGSFHVVCDGDSGCIVTVTYTSDGTWEIGLRPIGENVPTPNAHLFRQDHGYSSVLTVDDVLHVSRRVSVS